MFVLTTLVEGQEEGQTKVERASRAHKEVVGPAWVSISECKALSII